jgi:hypothetical protein
MEHIRALALAVLATLDKDKSCPEPRVFCDTAAGLMQGQCGIVADKRVPEVAMKLDRLFMGSERLSERIAGLESRLCPVLRSVPASEGKLARAEYCSPIGGQLGEIEARIELMISAVDFIAERIEL